MTYARFERFVLNGPDSDRWMVLLFWPHFLALMAFLVIAPIHDYFAYRETRQSEITRRMKRVRSIELRAK